MFLRWTTCTCLMFTAKNNTGKVEYYVTCYKICALSIVGSDIDLGCIRSTDVWTWFGFHQYFQNKFWCKLWLTLTKLTFWGEGGLENFSSTECKLLIDDLLHICEKQLEQFIFIKDQINGNYLAFGNNLLNVCIQNFWQLRNCFVCTHIPMTSSKSFTSLSMVWWRREYNLLWLSTYS